MALGGKIFLDDLTSDSHLGRTTLPRRVLGTNRRDSDDCSHLHRHWVLRCVCGFRGVLSITLIRSAACRAFILGPGSSHYYRIGEGWMDRRGCSKRRLECCFHVVWSGRPRVQYIHEVGVYVTFFAGLIYRPRSLREYRIAEF